MKKLVNISTIIKVFSLVEQHSWSDDLMFKNLYDENEFQKFYDLWVKPMISTLTQSEMMVLYHTLMYILSFYKESELEHITTDADILIPFGSKPSRFYKRLWEHLFSDDFKIEKTERKNIKLLQNNQQRPS